MLARAGRIMEPWFAALARPTAAVPSAAAHNNALAWRTSRAGAVCERASPSSSTRCPPVISKGPAAATNPTHTTTDHHLSDTPLEPSDTEARMLDHDAAGTGRAGLVDVVADHHAEVIAEP